MREHLLASGEAVILGKGYAAAGLAEILAQAGVPKGSFYHYFRSKEGFAVEMLQRYFSDYDQRLCLILNSDQGSARSRLLSYFQVWHDRHCAESGYPGCLAVKLSGEVCDLSEPMREALVDGMNGVVKRLAEAIKNAQQDGSLAAHIVADYCAQTLYALWIGSSLLKKVQHSSRVLQLALAQTEAMLPSPTL